MAEIQYNPQNKRKQIEFKLHAPQAKDVILIGDFNQWNPKKHPMKKGNLGAWQKTVMLTPGTYEYKFMVDGKWQEDPSNGESRLNAFGTYNNLITIGR